MENVPGWEVGTYYGDPVFKTMPEDYLPLPYVPLREYYAHAPNKAFADRAGNFAWV